MAAKLSFWQKIKRAVTGSLIIAAGIVLGLIGLGVVLVVTSALVLFSLAQKIKKAVTSPFGIGVGIGSVLGGALAVTSVFAFGAPAIVGGVLFVTGAVTGAVGGAFAQLHAYLRESSKAVVSVVYQVPQNNDLLPGHQRGQTFNSRISYTDYDSDTIDKNIEVFKKNR